MIPATNTPVERNSSKKLSGTPKDAPKTGYAAFAPIIEQYLKEHLFCDIFERDLLTWQERELATVSILTALGEGVEPMLKSHAAISLRQGITEGALCQMTKIVNGLKNGDPFARGMLMRDNPNFTDKAWLQGYVAPEDGFDCSVSSVTFAPGCRNSWHSHRGGQILLCTSGKGYYQEKGQPIRLLLPGDVVKIAPRCHPLARRGSRQQIHSHRHRHTDGQRRRNVDGAGDRRGIQRVRRRIINETFAGSKAFRPIFFRRAINKQ